MSVPFLFAGRLYELTPPRRVCLHRAFLGAESTNCFPDGDPTRSPIVRWRSCANLFYSNWLNDYVYQTTPYDVKDIQ